MLSALSTRLHPRSTHAAGRADLPHVTDEQARTVSDQDNKRAPTPAAGHQQRPAGKRAIKNLTRRPSEDDTATGALPNTTTEEGADEPEDTPPDVSAENSAQDASPVFLPPQA